MSGQHDQQDKRLTGQSPNQAGHCPLTGCFLSAGMRGERKLGTLDKQKKIRGGKEYLPACLDILPEIHLSMDRGREAF